MTIQLPKKYSQNDPSWKNKTLGTKGTIGAYGCLITDVAMMLCLYGHDETPATLNDKLKANGGYANGNLFVWGAINNMYKDVAYGGQVQTFDPLTKSQMDFIKGKIDKGYPVILLIDTIPSTSQLDEHWILAIDYEGDDFMVQDPWDGATKRITSWGIRPQDLIYAYAYYTGKIAIDPVTDPLQECLKIHDGDVTKMQSQEKEIADLKKQIEDLRATEERLITEKDKVVKEKDLVIEITQQKAKQDVELYDKEIKKLQLERSNAIDLVTRSEITINTLNEKVSKLEADLLSAQKKLAGVPDTPTKPIPYKRLYDECVIDKEKLENEYSENFVRKSNRVGVALVQEILSTFP